MFGTYCRTLNYYCVEANTVTRSGNPQANCNGRVVADDYLCNATQSAVIISSPSAYISDLWQAKFNDYFLVVAVSAVVIGVTIGGILGRLMFPKNL